MNDDDVLAAMRCTLTRVKDSLTDVHMDKPPYAIMAQARGRRMRRTMPAVGAGGAALGIGLALALSGSPPTARSVHVNLDAWSVNTTSSGKIDVTIRQLRDPAGLSRTLANAGVPVKLTFGRVCTSESASMERELEAALHKLPGRGEVMLVINPAAIPAGSELVIGIGALSDGHKQGPVAAFGLMKVGSQLHCQAAGGKQGGVKKSGG